MSQAIRKKSVLVVGGGLGGMSAAIRLQLAGYHVQLWEKNQTLGGKVQEYTEAGFRWDAGPSLVTMPQVIEDLFAAAGESMDPYLSLQALPNTCRYFWADGKIIDEDEAFWRMPEVQRFLRYAKGIYDLSGEAFLHYPPEEFWRALTMRSLPKLRHLPKVATFRSLAGKVNASFSDPYLRQIFSRFATYNGSSPYKTPATFNIIPYVEHKFGGWYPKGGVVSIARALEKLARKVGVKLRMGIVAQSYNRGEVMGSDGTQARPDIVVCNQDVLAAAQGWLHGVYSEADRAELVTPPLSCSGYVMFLGVKRKYEQLSHHNIFFGSDYPREFRQIYDDKQLPEEPTIYVAVTARSDPEHAPKNQDNFFVLVNSPALPPGKISDEEKTAYGKQVIQRLEQMGLKNLEQEIQVQRIFTASDFAHRDLSHNGSLYGWASHSIPTSLFRPPLQHPHLKNLYFVGGTTHPGGGIPLVLLSGKMVAEKICRSDCKA